MHTLGAVIKTRLIALLDAVIALPVTLTLAKLYSGTKECSNSTAIILPVILATSILLVPWIAFYAYKFKMVEKELLAREPTFYSDKESSRWFDHYAKIEDEKSP